MKVLVLNCGSSSIKYELFENQDSLTEGLVEKIGEKGSKIKTYKQGIKLMIDQLLKSGKIKSIDDIKSVGHRVVHGGELSESCIIDKKVIDTIKKFSALAPLHNPPNLKGIMEMKKVLPKIKHVAVFDTAFHQTMPETSYIYALPYDFYKKYKIRRYGFHGTSHKYVAQKAAEMLGKPLDKLNLITCHLGAGCSMAAIKQGKVIDTSMGLTPLEGLIMATRTGDIDPGILIHLSKKLKLSPDKLDALLNKKSGLLGVSGIGKDFRQILDCAKKGNKRCKLALDMFCYRIKKYVGAYTAALGKVDVIIFTGGIGENNSFIRSCVTDIECLGISIDENQNKMFDGKQGTITSNDSNVKVLVIPTDEEKLIAIETLSLVK